MRVISVILLSARSIMTQMMRKRVRLRFLFKLERGLKKLHSEELLRKKETFTKDVLSDQVVQLPSLSSKTEMYTALVTMLNLK